MGAFDPRAPGGDPSLYAAEVNLWNDVGRAHKRRFNTGGRGQRGFFFDFETIVRVQNVGTEPLTRYAAVEITDVILKPSDNEDDALGEITFKVRRPTANGNAKTRWAIALQPCAASDICYALVDGIVWCKINVANAGDASVEVVANSFVPMSSSTGSSQIVWVNGGVGTASSTGEQWAVIRISGGGSAAADEGQYPWQSKIMGATNQPTWDWQRSHGLL